MLGKAQNLSIYLQIYRTSSTREGEEANKLKLIYHIVIPLLQIKLLMPVQRCEMGIKTGEIKGSIHQLDHPPVAPLTHLPLQSATLSSVPHPSISPSQQPKRKGRNQTQKKGATDLPSKKDEKQPGHVGKFNASMPFAGGGTSPICSF